MCMDPSRLPVTKYTIVLAPSKDPLVRDVNELLEAGWEAQGPLSIKYPKNALLPMYEQSFVWRKTSKPPAPPAGSSGCLGVLLLCGLDRKSTRLNSSH